VYILTLLLQTTTGPPTFEIRAVPLGPITSPVKGEAVWILRLLRRKAAHLPNWAIPNHQTVFLMRPSQRLPLRPVLFHRSGPVPLTVA
jgi:hypothetical protein